MAGLIPFNRRNILSREIGNFYNMIDDFFNNWPYEVGFTAGTFRMDVREDDNEYIIEAELHNYIHKEKRQTSMSRSVYLADSKEEGIKATLDNGILKIVVPKKESAKKSRRIEIE